jgi:hypothetical protein
MAALEKFEATEANLVKLERLWGELESRIPTGVGFGSSPEYEERQRSYRHVLAALPKIEGWKPESEPWTLDEIASSRLDAMELDEPAVSMSIEATITEPGRELAEYRFRLNNKRRALIRDALVELIDSVDADIRTLRAMAHEQEIYATLGPEHWLDVKDHIKQIEVLLGSSVPKPPRWSDMLRHMHFGCVGDLNDIEKQDWPNIKQNLRQSLYGENEPLPVAVEDLSDLVAAKPRGAVVTRLEWRALDDEGFERLIFSLISDEQSYENPEWLMQTRAPDRGRDLSVTRTSLDPLSGTLRQRVVIQCKHWLSRSVALPDAAAAKEQMALWANPRVDILVIATSGRFTADAVTWIEQYNETGSTPRIEMWPESHLERLLSARPALIADFRLR